MEKARQYFTRYSAFYIALVVFAGMLSGCGGSKTSFYPDPNPIAPPPLEPPKIAASEEWVAPPDPKTLLRASGEKASSDDNPEGKNSGNKDTSSLKSESTDNQTKNDSNDDKKQPSDSETMTRTVEVKTPTSLKKVVETIKTTTVQQLDKIHQKATLKAPDKSDNKGLTAPKTTSKNNSKTTSKKPAAKGSVQVPDIPDVKTPQPIEAKILELPKPKPKAQPTFQNNSSETLPVNQQPQVAPQPLKLKPLNLPAKSPINSNGGNSNLPNPVSIPGTPNITGPSLQPIDKNGDNNSSSGLPQPPKPSR